MVRSQRHNCCDHYKGERARAAALGRPSPGISRHASPSYVANKQFGPKGKALPATRFLDDAKLVSTTVPTMDFRTQAQTLPGEAFAADVH